MKDRKEEEKLPAYDHSWRGAINTNGSEDNVWWRNFNKLQREAKSNDAQNSGS